MESLRKYYLYPLHLSNVIICMVYLQSIAGDCPADGRTWVPFEHSCYYFVHGEEDIKNYTFHDAQRICAGHEQVSIQSAEENEFIVHYSHEVWKGSVDMWLGMYYDTDVMDLAWSDQTDVTFTNWDETSSPSDLVPMDTCVAMHTSTGKWKNVTCDEAVLHGVVCEHAELAEEGRSRPSPLLSALVIMSVVGIMGISAAIWFLQQRRHVHPVGVITSFEYHPPFRTPKNDEACLVEAEEVDDSP